MSFTCIIHSAPPTLPAGMLKPGQLIKLLKAEKAGPYCNIPPPNSIVRFHSRSEGRNGPYVSLYGDDGESYAALESSLEAIRVTKAEVAERRQKIRSKLLDGSLRPYRCQGANVGSDPEIFAVDAHGQVIPAFAFLTSKAQKQYIDWQGKPGGSAGGGTVFWDGFQAEWTTIASCCIANVVDKVRAGMVYTLAKAKELDPKATLTSQSVLGVPQELLDTSPKEGVMLGCAPSHNAYFEGVNPLLDGLDPLRLPVRFAGFHIHMGCGALTVKQAKPIVRAIDRIAGVASVAIFRGMEDRVRRLYYGLAGEYRLPDHGLEYRVLSSAGLAHPVLTHLCFDLVRMGFTFGKMGFLHAWEATDAEVATAINDLNVEMALEQLERNKSLLTAILRAGYQAHTSLGDGAKDRAVDKALRLIFEGATNLVNTTDLTANWSLEGAWQSHSDGDRVSLANWKFE